MFFLFLAAFTPAAHAAVTGLQPETQKQTAIPFKRLGAELDKRYGEKAAAPVAIGSGYSLTAKMQALQAEVTPAGLAVTSLAKTEGLGTFSIVPVAVNGVQVQVGSLSPAQPAADGTIMLDRGCVAERFSSSSDGIRQDFIIAKAPAGNPAELVLSLAVQGATVSAHDKKPNAALLTLPRGRKLVYGRLHVIDAGGKELSARMDVSSVAKNELRIIVAAANAKYPVTIDPTITDDDWEIVNDSVPGVSGSVSAFVFDSFGNLYIGGGFKIAGRVMVNDIAKWDGANWSALGSGTNNDVCALATDSSGNVYAGGFLRLLAECRPIIPLVRAQCAYEATG